MKIKVADALLVVLSLLVFAPGVSAQEEPQDRAEGALFLLLPVGAQGVSLGRAMTWVEGAEGAFWNPAGLAGVDRSQGVLFRSDLPVDVRHNAKIKRGELKRWAEAQLR